MVGTLLIISDINMQLGFVVSKQHSQLATQVFLNLLIYYISCKKQFRCCFWSWPQSVRILGQSWSYGSWNNNYLCNQFCCEFKYRSWRGVLNTTLCDKVCQWLAVDLWFSLGTLGFLRQEDLQPRYNDILLKVALNTTTTITVSIYISWS